MGDIFVLKRQNGIINCSFDRKGSMEMYINKKKFVDEIWNGTFGANNNQCAQALGVEPVQLLRFVYSEKSLAGPLFLGGLAIYCRNHGLDFWSYIFLLPS